MYCLLMIQYGDRINLYCLVEYLTNVLNLDGHRIIIVECLSSESSIYFDNDVLQEMLTTKLKELGVRVLENVIPVGYKGT